MQKVQVLKIRKRQKGREKKGRKSFQSETCHQSTPQNQPVKTGAYSFSTYSESQMKKPTRWIWMMSPRFNDAIGVSPSIRLLN
jgi:hypothetical protein